MELEGDDGSKIHIDEGSRIDFGRGLGFPSNDLTVSRHHISLELQKSAGEKNDNQVNPDDEPRVHFEVLGKNPIWVYIPSREEIRVFRKSSKGELRVGHGFCVSDKTPILFTLSKSEVNGGEVKDEKKLKEMEKKESASEDTELIKHIRSNDEEDEDLGFGSLDFSNIDPVREFGFLKMGHEFNNYPKQMIRDIKDINWFLEERKGNSDESGEDGITRKDKRKGKKGLRRKKKDISNEDEDWTGESEDDKALISSLRRDKRPRYTTTRSKDFKTGNSKNITTGSSKNSSQKKTIDDIEDDETLGGFIVNDEELEEEKEENDEDEDEDKEEEEEFDEDDENGSSDDEEI